MQKITFWDLITSPDIKKICIPTIQRDYALGRRNKVDKRNSFLIALKTAVCTNEQLPLDFVYGVDNDTMFIPLDGQQRLTTLWLLHWYIAYKAGLLNRPEIKDAFLKFSYETNLCANYPLYLYQMSLSLKKCPYAHGLCNKHGSTINTSKTLPL